MTIKDIYEGEIIGVWETEDTVSMSFYPNAVTLNFPREHWDEVKKELRELARGQMTVLKDAKKKKKKGG